MEGHPVVVPNGAARVSERSCEGTESRGHGPDGSGPDLREEPCFFTH